MADSHFGNLISSKPGLVTKSHSLERFEPIQRVFLSASGNLQQILSAYHGADVTVKVLKNEFVPERLLNEENEARTDSNGNSEGYYDRSVSLNCKGRVLCIADSIVHCTSPESKEVVASGQVGIGQLFKYFNVLPNFELIECGQKGDSAFKTRLWSCIDCEALEFDMWRRYVLSSHHLRCEITEYFCDGCTHIE